MFQQFENFSIGIYYIVKHGAKELQRHPKIKKSTLHGKRLQIQIAIKYCIQI